MSQANDAAETKPSGSGWQVAVVGAGPAGYAAAIRCAQLGLRTVCIDDREGAAQGANASLGGTCLNVGCIPSKALLEGSLHYSRLKSGYPGVKARPSLDLSAMMAAKQATVDKLCSGVAQLFKGYGVDALQGRAMLLGAGQLRLDDRTDIQAEQIILAPGSLPAQIPSAPFDSERIVDSTAALSFAEVPKTLCVIGAGAVGLELGSVWARLGAKVVVLEALQDFLPFLDRDMARLALRSLSAQGLDIQLSCTLQEAVADASGVQVRWSNQQQEEETAQFEQLVVAVGRRPNTEGLLDAGCGLQLDERGFIPVSQHCQTDLRGVWAVGDAAVGPAAAPMLAHRATEEGVMVAERIAGEPAEVNYALVPSVIYTHPEIAVIGRTATACEAEGIACRSGAFPFAANGRALAADDSEGKVKLVGETVAAAGAADSTGGRLLGAQVVGPSAADLVQQVAIAMEFGAEAEDLALTMFGHPTLSEVLHEAALDLAGKPLHQVKKRRPAGG